MLNDLTLKTLEFIFDSSFDSSKAVQHTLDDNGHMLMDAKAENTEPYRRNNR